MRPRQLLFRAPIWISAHTTQFVQPGYKYLNHSSGVGHLTDGGSYVTLTNGKDWSLIIEKMSHDHSRCIRPFLPEYAVMPELATFVLGGSMKTASIVHVWRTQLDFSYKNTSQSYYGNSTFFERQTDIEVKNGQFQLQIDVDW